MKNCKYCSLLFKKQSRSQLFCSIDCQFWIKVDKKDSDQCWNWTGKSRWNGGYGKINLRPSGGKPKYYRAHRLSLVLHGILLQSDDVVCHKCDNPECVNPAHLFVGTMKDNTRDMMSKNRQSKPPTRWGESHHKATLTDEQIACIRSIQIKRGDAKKLADKYGVSTTSIHRIKNNQTRVINSDNR